jgi:hypothetical protein
LVIPSLVLSAWIETRVSAQSAVVTKMKPKEVQWQAEKEDLLRRMADLEKKKQLIQVIEGQKLPPIPGWVLSYIANITPAELFLSELHVRRMDGISEASSAAPSSKNPRGAKVNLTAVPEAPPGGLWSVRLVGDGKATAPVGDTAAPNILDVFERWTNQLATGPLHLKITTKILPTAQSGETTAWLMAGGQSQGLARRPPFIIEGVIR